MEPIQQPSGHHSDKVALYLSGVDFSQGQRYLLRYRTTFIPGMALHNYGVLTNAGGFQARLASLTINNSGSAIGTLLGRIRIIKG